MQILPKESSFEALKLPQLMLQELQQGCTSTRERTFPTSLSVVSEQNYRHLDCAKGEQHLWLALPTSSTQPLAIKWL